MTARDLKNLTGEVVRTLRRESIPRDLNTPAITIRGRYPKHRDTRSGGYAAAIPSSWTSGEAGVARAIEKFILDPAA